MPPLIPGTPEHFFDQIAKFLRANAQGDVRIIIISETNTKQLWINSMVDSVVWEFGVLEAALETIRNNYRRNQERAMVEIEKTQAEAQQKVEEQELRDAEVKGKPS